MLVKKNKIYFFIFLNCSTLERFFFFHHCRFISVKIFIIHLCFLFLAPGYPLTSELYNHVQKDSACFLWKTSRLYEYKQLNFISENKFRLKPTVEGINSD